MNAAPTLARLKDADRWWLVAEGSWTGAHGRQLEAVVAEAGAAPAAESAATIDMSRIEAIDTFGAWILQRLVRQSARAGRPLAVSGLSPRYQGLVDQIARTNTAKPPRQAPHNLVVGSLETVGRVVSDLGSDATAFANVLGAIGSSVLNVLARPSRFRLTSTVHQLDRVGWQAMPIIMLITLLIGGIIAQQGFFHFRRFGAEVYAVDMTGILVLREIGVLIVAIMVAGRSGSSYTAELGSMKMREEIDALSTMGLDPIEVLMLPRIIALICALPILTFIGSLAALYGGGLVAWFYGGMEPAIFIARLHEAVSVTHFEVGIIKAPFMALVIGLVACSEGLRVKGSAESLGKQTTTSVVKSIFLVIVLDGLFAVFFASIGM